MNKLQFQVEIHASKENVWTTLWRDETFRQWAGIIDPGTHMVGELKTGKEVQFISSENGYGVTTLVDKLVENEYLLLKHSADTQDHGAKVRAKEWTGGEESYTLEERFGVTTLKAAFDVPPEMEDYFKENFPKALEVVKSLAEKNQL